MTQCAEHAANIGSRASPWLTAPRPNWPILRASREEVLRTSAMAGRGYLLQPEIEQLLTTVSAPSHWLLYSTLWLTGAKISEALALTPAAIQIDAQAGAGTVTLGQRQVPVCNPAGYLDQLVRAQAAIDQHSRLWPISRQAAQKGLDTAAERLQARGVELPVAPTPNTFRHSFAVHLVLHGVPLDKIQCWLGHRNIESTTIYSAVLTHYEQQLVSMIHKGGINDAP